MEFCSVGAYSGTGEGVRRNGSGIERRGTFPVLSGLALPSLGGGGGIRSDLILTSALAGKYTNFSSHF